MPKKKFLKPVFIRKYNLTSIKTTFI